MPFADLAFQSEFLAVEIVGNNHQQRDLISELPTERIEKMLQSKDRRLKSRASRMREQTCG
jgi:hypothetical protein